MKKFSVILALALISAAAWAMPIADNFDDGNIGNGPDTGKPPASWSGDIDTEPGWKADGTGANNNQVGEAACDDAGKVMTLNFGSSYTYVEVDFELTQTDGTEGAYRFEYGFSTDAGDLLMESSPQKYRYAGNHSIASYDGNGNITGAPADTTPGYTLNYINQKLPTSGWQHFKVVFDGSESKYAIRVYTEDHVAGIDTSKGYGTLIYAAYYEQPISGSASTADGFFFKNRDGAVTWMVDDVSVTPEPATMLLLAFGASAALKKRK